MKITVTDSAKESLKKLLEKSELIKPAVRLVLAGFG